MSDEWDRETARSEPVVGRCLFCKVQPKDAASETTWKRVGDDEQLCSRCNADLREYGRTLYAQIWVRPGLNPSVRHLVETAWQEYVQPKLVEIHEGDHKLYQMPEVVSNAREHDDPGLDSEHD